MDSLGVTALSLSGCVRSHENLKAEELLKVAGIMLSAGSEFQRSKLENYPLFFTKKKERKFIKENV